MSDNSLTVTPEQTNLKGLTVFEENRLMAKTIQQSTMLPELFKNKPANCYVAVELAREMGIPVFTLMQNMYEIHGKIGLSSTLMIAKANESGIFTNPLQFVLEGQGDNRKCTCSATTKNGAKCETSVTISMAKSEGWYGRKGSKWPNMPDQMLQYRAAAFFVRLYCPQVLQGMQTIEEVSDIVDVTDAPSASQTTINEVKPAAAEPKMTVLEPVPPKKTPPKKKTPAAAKTEPAPAAAPAPKPAEKAAPKKPIVGSSPVEVEPDFFGDA